MRIVLFILALVLALIGGGLIGRRFFPPSTSLPLQSIGQPSTEKDYPGIQGITAENFPRIDGATSTRPLGDLLLARALGMPGDLQRVSYYPGSSSDERSLKVVFPPTFNTEQVERYQQLLNGTSCHSTTHDAYLNLLRNPGDRKQVPNTGRVDFDPPAKLLLVATKPSKDELNEAKAKGIEFDMRPFALDAFVFMVNEENSLTGLTLDQVRDIYTGKVKNWQAVGGHDLSILPFIRSRNSGSQELMEGLVMKGQSITASNDMMEPTMMGLIERLSSTPDGLGYTVYYYQSFMVPSPKCKLISIDGVMPTAESITSRKYPLTTEMYLVTRKDLPAGSPAAIIRDWLLSPAGQRLVAESGYVPLK